MCTGVYVIKVLTFHLQLAQSNVLSVFYPAKYIASAKE